jgi:hypothetical protein
VSVSYIKPVLRDQSVINLMAAAGYIAGIGDWRQQRGSGNYGSFKVVDTSDSEYLEIINATTYAGQAEAMQRAEPYDKQTEKMLGWFSVESKRRGFKAVV